MNWKICICRGGVAARSRLAGGLGLVDVELDGLCGGLGAQVVHASLEAELCHVQAQRLRLVDVCDADRRHLHPGWSRSPR